MWFFGALLGRYSQSSWATGHAIRSNGALRACNHFYRCRGHQGNETAAKNHGSGLAKPSHPVTGICANFAKTSVYGKEQHTKSHHLHQRQGGRSLRQVDPRRDEPPHQRAEPKSNVKFARAIV